MPARAIRSIESGNGKKASDASTLPRTRSPAFSSAIRTASTRLVCPSPAPTRFVPWQTAIALLVSRRTIVKAKLSDWVSAGAGAALVTTRHVAGSSQALSGRWAKIAPAMLRSSKPDVASQGSPAGTSTSRTLPFHVGRVVSSSTASGSKAGAAITSTNSPGARSTSAQPRSNVRLTATIEPKALVGSAAIAVASASAAVAPAAAPQGFVCFTTTAAGVASKPASRVAPSRSSRLL